MRYDGGKGGAGVHQKIINLMPRHRVYIEPFVGGGNIYERKKPAEVSILIDADFDVCEYWHDHKIGSTIVMHGDAAPILKNYNWTGNELVYCDPPYVLSARKGGKIYRHEMTDSQHKDLVSLLLTIPAAIILSGYRNEIYDTALSSWNSIDFEAMTRRGMAKETLWFNFEPPAELHDFRYLGADFRERERIKRKRARWKERLMKMDVSERMAIMEALEEISSSKVAMAAATPAASPEKAMQPGGDM